MKASTKIDRFRNLLCASLKTPRRRLAFGGIVASLIAALPLVWYWQNDAIQIERFVVESPKIPASFDGLKIVQISDAHDKEFGPNNARLFALVRVAKPDLIAITGDLTEARNGDVEYATRFCAVALQIAPVYYVSGNHEVSGSPERHYEPLKKALVATGVRVLDVEAVEVKRGTDAITLAGVSDPLLTQIKTGESDSTIVARDLSELSAASTTPERFRVLLSHRPELIDEYAKFGADLVLSGHAHGGQIRLPFIGGLYAPNQGVFPRYTSGVYRRDGTVEIVSRGLGPSKFPARVFNRPHLVVCELKHCD